MTSHLSKSPAAGRCQMIPLGRADEGRGSLCVAQIGDHISFEIQRVYWVFAVPDGAERARHAHRDQHELLVAVRGTFTVHCDDGHIRSSYALASPDVGLHMPPMVFHHLDDFSPDAVCLVLASGPYDSSEYVHDYDEFRALMARR